MNTHRGPNAGLQASGILTQKIGFETLVYNEQTHQAFCLNPVATETWSRFDGQQTPAEISAAASVVLGSPVSEQAVLLAIAELRGHGLIEPEPAAAARPVPTRRDLMRQIGAGAMVMLPAVAVVMAPRAAQAYNGCVNCDAQQEKSAAAATAAQQRATAVRDLGLLPMPDQANSPDQLRKKRQQNGEIWVP